MKCYASISGGMIYVKYQDIVYYRSWPFKKFRDEWLISGHTGCIFPYDGLKEIPLSEVIKEYEKDQSE